MTDYIWNPQGHEEVAPPDGRWNGYGADREDEPAPVLTPVKTDQVFRPNHYARFWPEPITVINAWDLNFNRGNAVKYLARAGHKDDLLTDLEKAKRYIEIEIECLKRRRKAVDGANPKDVWSATL